MSSGAPPPYASEKPMNFQQAPPPPPAQVVTLQPVYVGSPVVIMGSYPVQCMCSHCGQRIVTRTEKKNGLLTWLICGGLFIFGLWPCCFIPFCVDGCKDTEHYCPSCSAFIGASKQI